MEGLIHGGAYFRNFTVSARQVLILYRIARKAIRYNVYIRLVFRPFWVLAVLDFKGKCR